VHLSDSFRLCANGDDRDDPATANLTIALHGGMPAAGGGVNCCGIPCGAGCRCCTVQ
jgi:hypothetical protein